VDIGRRKQANPSELGNVYQLLVNATAWLREKGLSQWSRVYPVERFAKEVSAGQVWYWGIADEPIATVTVYENRPEYYPAGAWEDSATAWYLCRLAIARQFVGQRVGESVLASLEGDAAAAAVQALRLDVATSSSFLERYYVGQGFERHQVVEIFGERAALLEKTIRRE